MLQRATEFVRRADDRWNQSGDALWIEWRSCLTVDQQAITSQYDRCLDALTLPNCGDELPDTGQLDTSPKVTAKLEIGIVEVKH